MPRTTADKKSILIAPSRVVSRADNLEGGEETEIEAQIIIPDESRWRWLVLFCSFTSIAMLDGIVFTFGSLLDDMQRDFNTTAPLMALINSTAIAIYFVAGPIVSAFINRFGFRACAMTGSVICSFSLFTSYFVQHYTSLFIFYGVISGFGFSLINLSCGLVVGFYFEKLRSTALTITNTGSSLGVMTLFPLNSYLVKITSWRETTLLHSGLLGMIFFFGMSYRPLLALTVKNTNDDPTRTVTYLPNISAVGLSTSSKANALVSTATERRFGAVTNINFPTAAAVANEADASQVTQPGPSSTMQSRVILRPQTAQGTISRHHLKQVQSFMSANKAYDIAIDAEQPKKKVGCFARLFHWEPHIPQTRPMYRDDAFYSGKIEKLPEYQKSMMDTTDEGKANLEYKLAVSRAAATVDLRERRGICTIAVRRVLATMMDPILLRRLSFILLCISGNLIYMGYLVPFVYIRDRNKEQGIDDYHCALFVSVIGLSNALGRGILGALANKFDPVHMVWMATMTAGIATCVSNLSYTLYFQYGYCCVFGFCISSVACLKSLSLVSLYGLEKLTNAMGMLLLFQGIGSLLSTPIAATVQDSFGYFYAFILAGTFIFLGGAVAIPVRAISNREKLRTAKRTVTIKENK